MGDNNYHGSNRDTGYDKKRNNAIANIHRERNIHNSVEGWVDPQKIEKARIAENLKMFTREGDRFVKDYRAAMLKDSSLGGSLTDFKQCGLDVSAVAYSNAALGSGYLDALEATLHDLIKQQPDGIAEHGISIKLASCNLDPIYVYFSKEKPLRVSLSSEQFKQACDYCGFDPNAPKLPDKKAKKTGRGL